MGSQLLASKVVIVEEEPRIRNVPALPTAMVTLTFKDRAATPLNTLRVDGKWDGAYGNDVTIVITPPTSGATGEFNLTVEDNGLIAEVFPNLSMESTKPSYVET